jgi:hypothetical protein
MSESGPRARKSAKDGNRGRFKILWFLNRLPPHLAVNET